MSELLSFSTEKNIKETPLSESDILSRIVGIKQLPKFPSMLSFEASDFFRDNYLISLDNFNYEDKTHFESLHFLKSQEYYDSVKALQRILIFLGYLQETDLIGDTIYGESETQTSYFGIFGPKTAAALIQFQKVNCLLEDGIVGINTKISLHQSVFYKFHIVTPVSTLSSELAELKCDL